jgi:hypothetical protein
MSHSNFWDLYRKKISRKDFPSMHPEFPSLSLWAWIGTKLGPWGQPPNLDVGRISVHQTWFGTNLKVRIDIEIIILEILNMGPRDQDEVWIGISSPQWIEMVPKVMHHLFEHKKGVVFFFPIMMSHFFFLLNIYLFHRSLARATI